MTYLLNIGLFTLAIFSISKWSKGFPLEKYLFYVLIIRLLAGIAVTAVYLFYYKEGDLVYMFHQGKLLKQMLWENPIDFWKFPHTEVPMHQYYFGAYKDLNSRLLFFVKIISLVNLLTNDNIWLTSLWFSLFGFLGFWYCANVLMRLFPESKVAILFSFFLCPSVVFWSSSLLKESLLCSAVCFCVGIFLEGYVLRQGNIHFKSLRFLSRNSIKIGFFFCCLYLILQIKYYYLAALLPILIAYLSVDYIQKKKQLKPHQQVFAFFTVLFFVAFLASFTHPNFHLAYFLIALNDGYKEAFESTDADNLIYLHDFKPTIWSLLKNTPQALFASLAEPLAWEAENNPLKLLAALENLFLYAVFIFTAKISLRWQKNSLILLACLTYIGILAVFLAVSMPSIGTLVRYKAGFLPFWAYLLTYWFRLPWRFYSAPKPSLHNQK